VFPSLSFITEKVALKIGANLTWYFAGLIMLANLIYPCVVISYFNLHAIRASYMMMFATG